MPCSRSLLTGLLVVVVGIGASFALTACGSGSRAGHGEKVMDVLPNNVTFRLAASDKGVVTLAWIDNDHLKVTDLLPNTWDWSMPEVAATSSDWMGQPPEDMAIDYDRSGRLLVTWTTFLSDGLGVKERLRGADGNWQPAKTIARLPGKEVREVRGVHLALSSGKRSFAIGWYAGFRILKGNDWQPTARVGGEGSPVQVQLFEGEDPQALWILPNEKKLMHASVRPDGTLGKPRVLANADWSLSTAFDSSQAVAGWEYDDQAWASVWDGSRWTKPKMLGDWDNDSAAVSPIATAVSRGRVSVFWGATWRYSVWQRRVWARPISLARGDYGWDVAAGALGSGEMVFSALSGSRLNVAHLYRSGKRTSRKYPADPGGGLYEESASSARAVAHAWENEVEQTYDGPILHLFIWVYRP